MTTTLRQPTVVAPLLLAAVAGAFALSGQLQPRLVSSVILADLLVAAAIAWWMVTAGAHDPGRVLARRLMTPLLLILVGSLVALAPSGPTSWGVNDLVLDVTAVLAFFAVLGLVDGFDDREWRVLHGALAFGLAVVVLQLLMSGGSELRAQATFPNPNLAGHYVVTLTAALLVITPNPTHRRFILALGVAGWAASGSYGALFQAGAMVIYHLWSRNPGHARLNAVYTMAVGAMVGAVGYLLPRGPGDLVVAGVSTDRLNRSSGSRFELWADGASALGDRILGVGPGGVAHLGYADQELHNEYLAFLVERGPAGFIGLIALGAGLWLVTRSTGGARTLLVGFMAASVFRETLHYRHLWLCLALVIAHELRIARLDPADR